MNDYYTMAQRRFEALFKLFLSLDDEFVPGCAVNKIAHLFLIVKPVDNEFVHLTANAQGL